MQSYLILSQPNAVAQTVYTVLPWIVAREAEAARRLGFTATEGFHQSNLGRTLQQAGDDHAAINTLERAIEIGHTSGDIRVTFLASSALAACCALLGTANRRVRRWRPPTAGTTPREEEKVLCWLHACWRR